MPANDPMDPSKEKLIADLAAQAGLVLRNVRLVEDLRGSRRRLVSAQDEERRKLERNIHDGAQQQLVALAVKARLARQMTDRNPEKAADLLSQIEAETHQALEDLRDLARGIYPPLLADRGLPVALQAQARKSPIPVEVIPDGIGRYPQSVEAAVYFSVLEALQNVSKYADASRAGVRLEHMASALTFEVRDDGRGFDPASTGYGIRLAGHRRPSRGVEREPAGRLFGWRRHHADGFDPARPGGRIALSASNVRSRWPAIPVLCPD